MLFEPGSLFTGLNFSAIRDFYRTRDEISRDVVWTALSTMVPIRRTNTLPEWMGAAFYHGGDERVEIPFGLTAARETTLLAHEMAHVVNRAIDPRRWALYREALISWDYHTPIDDFDRASLIYEEERMAEERGRNIVLAVSGSLVTEYDLRAEQSLSEYRRRLGL